MGLSSIRPTQLPVTPKLTPVLISNFYIKTLVPVSNTPKAEKVIALATLTDGEIISINKDYPFQVEKVNGIDQISINTTTGARQLDCDVYGTTPSGKTVRVHYPGQIIPTQALVDFESGKSTLVDFEELHLRNQPIFEVDDEIESEYAWVKSKSFLGKGRFIKEDDKLYVQYYIYLVE